MAYETRGSSRTRRSRQQERVEAAYRRIRTLSAGAHPYRWCPEKEVSILVGPDYLCPACGNLTSLAD
jgi:hypothetical protein